MLNLSGAWLCGLSSVPQGSGLSSLRSSGMAMRFGRATQITPSSLCRGFNCIRSQGFTAVSRKEIRELCGGEGLFNSLTPMGSGGNKKLPPHRFPMVGIVRAIRQTTTQLPLQTSSPWFSVCPPYSVDSMNRPNPTRGHPSEGVG
jgi:hypothetical protein